MSHLIEIQHLRLEKERPELSLSLRPGQFVAVYGRAGSGKSEFLRTAAKLDRAPFGRVHHFADALLAGHPPFARKVQPDAWTRRCAGHSGATRAAEALVATGLWDVRKKAISGLGLDRQAAAELLEALAGHANILFIDGQLDRLDPWTRASVADLLAKRLREGAGAIVVTEDCQWLLQCDLAVVFKDRQPIFAGSPDELERRHGIATLEVETVRGKEVRALCDSFEVRIEESDAGLRIEAADHQALAARALVEGYGDVKAVVVHRPTPEELLRGLI